MVCCWVSWGIICWEASEDRRGWNGLRVCCIQRDGEVVWSWSGCGNGGMKKWKDCGNKRKRSMWSGMRVCWRRVRVCRQSGCVLCDPARQPVWNGSSQVTSIHPADDPFLCPASTGYNCWWLAWKGHLCWRTYPGGRPEAKKRAANETLKAKFCEK